MKRFTHLLILPFTLGVIVADMASAIAASTVRQIPQSQAQGLVGNGVTVTVWSGSGTNLDFTPTGESIVKAWLDDPHAVVMDFDSPPGSRSHASIVHLKQVTDIHFPNLPETVSTLLTVVTQSQYGKRTYSFAVKYGSETPEYATLSIVPDLQPLASRTLGRGSHLGDWELVEQGLERAIAEQWIKPQSPVVLRTRNFLTYVRNGMPLQQAIEQAQISMSVVSRLLELGSPPPLQPSTTLPESP